MTADSSPSTESDSDSTDEGSSTTTKKAPAKKSSSRKTSATKGTSKGTAKKQSTRKAPRAEAPRRATASQIASSAARQLLELAGKEAEGVAGIQRSEDGWTVLVEVIEVRRIPDTTDVLALYEVEVDDDGDLLGYRRVRRYVRGVPGED